MDRILRSFTPNTYIYCCARETQRIPIGNHVYVDTGVGGAFELTNWSNSTQKTLTTISGNDDENYC